MVTILPERSLIFILILHMNLQNGLYIYIYRLYAKHRVLIFFRLSKTDRQSRAVAELVFAEIVHSPNWYIRQTGIRQNGTFAEMVFDKL